MTPVSVRTVLDDSPLGTDIEDVTEIDATAYFDLARHPDREPCPYMMEEIGTRHVRITPLSF